MTHKIVSAPWVLVQGGNLLREGAVVIRGGRIIEVNDQSKIFRKYEGAPKKKFDCLLMPGLVNAHMHLELSYLGLHSLEEKTTEEQQTNSDVKWSGSFTEWIAQLIVSREKSNATEEEIIKAALREARSQYDAGVVLIGDIGNISIDAISKTGFDQKTASLGGVKIYRMLEFLAPSEKASHQVCKQVNDLPESIIATAHAPYSTDAKVIGAIKNRARNLGHIFSIHTAETAGEKSFIKDKSGPFADFFRERGGLDQVFAKGITGESTVSYFDDLGILDQETLLVHCVHVSLDDVKLISDYGAKVCVCPSSNRYLGVGKAPVQTMLDMGIIPALGTDSNVSNPSLDLWREMAQLAEDFPDIRAEHIVQMATYAGSKALGFETDYGSIEEGKKADIIHVNSKKIANCKNQEELLKTLVSQGKPEIIEHIH